MKQNNGVNNKDLTLITLSALLWIMKVWKIFLKQYQNSYSKTPLNLNDGMSECLQLALPYLTKQN